MADPNLSFGFTDEQKLLRDSVLGTLQRVLPPEKIRELDKQGEYPFEACAALAEAGVNGIVYPAEYGGQDGSFTDLAVLAEALAYHYGGIAQAWGITCIYAGMHIALHGSDQMKREILPKVIAGEMRLALCLSEPDHGSDVASIETLAVRDGDDYILNGQKIYNSAAHVAHNLVVVCKTKPGRGYDGISMFVVDTTLPGVTVQRLDAL
ncbi:MAG: acyl-CoA/acyl-ACP dehydrogenase, partial [Rhodospirillaceae bacterium]|nr:acyl-CoA/acyl-ACP dehydrogenase [Rhodospirillaceae bacterium]